MQILKNIQLLSKDHDTSIPKLEKELGFSNGSIYNWDKNSPSIEKVQRVANHFNVSTDYLMHGYERTNLVSYINTIRGERSIDKFSEDTGIDINELTEICLGLISEPPSKDTLDRIANNSLDHIPHREIERAILQRTAGHDKGYIEWVIHPVSIKETTPVPNILNPKEKHDIAKDLEEILKNLKSNEFLTFDSEPLDDVTKELICISLENTMRLTKQLAKKKFTPETK